MRRWRYWAVTLIATVTIVLGCGRSEEERFIRTYRDILIVRELYPDTAIANPKVRAILRQNGFTEPAFRRMYIRMAQDPDRFRRLIDSLRRYAQRYARQQQDTVQR